MSDPTRSQYDAAVTASVLPNEANHTLTAGERTDTNRIQENLTGFQLIEEIGRGGMGIVYRARDLGLDREVAIKLLQERYEPASGTATRFIEEARITGQLQHPGIPAVYQVGIWFDGRPFLAMKLIKGRTLDRHLKDDGPGATRWLGTFESICHAVGFAHARGVIHRDLKPANVMVGAFGEVQVMDWGLAKVLTDKVERRPEGDATATATAIKSMRESDGSFTQAGSVLGTPAFMPPEQAAGELDKVDARSDVFGLGAILCVLLTGSPPLEGGDAERVRLNAVRGRTEEAFARLDASGADPDVVDLCKRCLAFEPADRPETANAVAIVVAGLRRAADERVKQAERDKLAAEVQTEEQRKRRRVGQRAAGALTLVLLVGIAGTTVGLLRADKARGDAEAEKGRADTARNEAETARDAAEKARADSDLQRQKAQARLEKAVQAVETVITRVAGPVWAARPDLQAERREMLEEAIAFFRSLSEEESKDPAVRRQVARAHLLVAGAYLSLADYDRCEAAAKAACDAYAAFVVKSPPDVLAACGEVESLILLGNSSAIRGRYAEALLHYEKGLEVAEAARAADPKSVDARIAVAQMNVSLGLFFGSRKPERTIWHLTKSLKIGEDLLAENRGDFRTLLLVVSALIDLASHDIAKNGAQAVARFARAAELVPELERLPPPSGRYADAFALARATLRVYSGAMDFRVGKKDEGLIAVRDGLVQLDRLLTVKPKSFPLRIHKMEFQAVLIDLLIRQRQVAEAEKLFVELHREQASLTKEIRSISWVMQIGLMQYSALLIEAARKGDAARVEREGPGTMKTADPTAVLGVRYNLACAYAQLAAHGPVAQRAEYAAQAVEALAALTDSTYFDNPRNVAHLDIDEDLDPLRDRADFKAFMATLRKRTPTAPKLEK